MPERLKCMDKRISDLLPWYVSDTLSETEKAMVEQHLTECNSCRNELENLRWISENAMSVGNSQLSEHINAQLLTIYSESKRELNSEVVQRIENHLSSCDQCANELELLHKINQSMEPENTGSFVTRIVEKIDFLTDRVFLKPAFAYILALLLLYPAWIGLFNNGRKSLISEPVQVRNLFVLEPGDFRSPDNKPQKIVLQKSSGYFALSFTTPVIRDGNYSYHAEISNSDNKIIWSSENLEFIDEYGTVIMICPTKYFANGTYALNITEMNRHTKVKRNHYLYTFSITTGNQISFEEK